MKKISDLLREKREEKGLSIEEIESETKIKKNFIEAIESGRFHALPSESYAQGFVRNYAKFLGIPLSMAIPVFRREYKSRHSIHIVPDFRRTQNQFAKRLILNTRSLLIVIAAVLIGIYLFFQYSSFFFPPALAITSPKNGQLVDGNIVEITGHADPYATVSVNNQEVYLTIQGTFKKSEYMFSGDNKITVVAKNRFGKETTRVITVRVK